MQKNLLDVLARIPDSPGTQGRRYASDILLEVFLGKRMPEHQFLMHEAQVLNVRRGQELGQLFGGQPWKLESPGQSRAKLTIGESCIIIFTSWGHRTLSS